MTDFRPRKLKETIVYFCEEHDITFDEPTCDNCKNIGWFQTTDGLLDEQE